MCVCVRATQAHHNLVTLSRALGIFISDHPSIGRSADKGDIYERGGEARALSRKGNASLCALLFFRFVRTTTDVQLLKMILRASGR